MSNILLVHAHHEPQSFSSSLARLTAEVLAGAGHEVAVTDLYAMGFQPVSDRRNFTTVADADYLKQQQEEAFATEYGGFAPELEAEMRKVEACDLLIFSFPLWWFGLPAILKGWVDRVFAYRRMYSRGKWYENGVGAGKRAMVLITTGGAETKYGPGGLHGPLEEVLGPIHRGIFWFNGFAPLEPFVGWAAAHGTDEDRRAVLEALRARLAGVLTEPARELPRVAEFDPETGVDAWPHYQVTLSRSRPVDGNYEKLVPDEKAYLETLRREGKLVSLRVARPDAAEWRAFLQLRVRDEETARAICAALPLAAYLDCEITPLAVTVG